MGFALARAWLKARYPSALFIEWAWLDTLKDIPRAIGLGLALWVGRRYWSDKELGVHLRGWKKAIVFGAVICVSELFLRLTYGYEGFDPKLLAILIASSYLVGLFE